MEGKLFEFCKDIRTEITFRDSHWSVECGSLCVKYWLVCSSDVVNSYVVIAKMRAAENGRMCGVV